MPHHLIGCRSEECQVDDASAVYAEHNHISLQCRCDRQHLPMSFPVFTDHMRIVRLAGIGGRERLECLGGLSFEITAELREIVCLAGWQFFKMRGRRFVPWPFNRVQQRECGVRLCGERTSSRYGSERRFGEINGTENVLE